MTRKNLQKKLFNLIEFQLISNQKKNDKCGIYLSIYCNLFNVITKMN